jgi:methyl-accepting chemotaxis protein
MPKKTEDPLQSLQHEVSQMKLAFEKMVDSNAAVVRRIETLQHSVDLVYQDRTIFEDVLAAVRSVQDVLLTNRRHQDLATHDLKADVQEVHDKVEKTKKDVINKVEDVKDSFEENTNELIEQVSKKKELFKEKFWKKIPLLGR